MSSGGAVAHNANAVEELATSLEHHVSGVEQVHVGLELNNGALLAWFDRDCIWATAVAAPITAVSSRVEIINASLFIVRVLFC